MPDDTKVDDEHEVEDHDHVDEASIETASGRFKRAAPVFLRGRVYVRVRIRVHFFLRIVSGFLDSKSGTILFSRV